MELPPYPDAADPCASTTPYILAAICANGVRVLVWVLASEIHNEQAARVGASTPCGGDCSKKVEMVMDLAAKKWKPEDIERVLKALG